MRIGDIDLEDEDLATHIRISGTTGKGKSTLLYDLLTQLILSGAGMCVLDPHGRLYRELLAYCCYIELENDRLFILDATQPEITATVNPFAFDSNINKKARILRDLTLDIWGKSSEAVQTEKILYMLFVALLEQGRPLADLFSLLKKGAVNPASIKTKFAREEWEKFNEQSERTMSSVRTRLMPLADEGLLALTDPCAAIDFVRLLDGQILLVNAHHERLHRDDCKTLSAFIVGEIWSRAFNRKTKVPPFYLVIDEVRLLASKELADVLRESQKFGLHVIFLDQDSGLPDYLKEALGNVSLFVQFLEKGEVMVTGWGSGTNHTYIEPKAIPGVGPDVMEAYTRSLAIVPKQIKLPPPIIIEPTFPGRGSDPHKRMQQDVKVKAEILGFTATVEKNDIDVLLEGHGTTVAVEVSVGNSPEYEAMSVYKNRAKYEHCVVVTTLPKKAKKLEALGIKVFDYGGLHNFLKSLETKRPWMTTQEFADEQRYDVQTVRRMCNRGELPAKRWGREWRIDRQKLADWKPQREPELKTRPFVLSKRVRTNPKHRKIMGIK